MIGEVGVPQTWNFIVPAGGAVLNRVGNATASTPFADNAIIRSTGTLLSNGTVFILANGNIQIDSGATINTGGGLVLSTLREDSDGPFATLGNLTFSGASTGSITIGTATTSGNLTAVGGTVSNAGSTVSGDLVLRSVTAGQGIDISAAANASVGGNLSVTTNNGTISGTNAVTVGQLIAGNQTATLNSGTASTTLANIANDFETVVATTSGTTADVTLVDANTIILGNSTIGRDLSVTAGGAVNTAGITTAGTVTVGGNATLISATSSNSSISFANNSTVGGWISAVTAGGAISINTTGNLTLGNITSNAAARQLGTGTAWTALAGTSTVAGGGVTGVTLTAGTTSPIYNSGPSVTFSSPIASADLPNATVYTGGIALPNTVTVENGGSGYTVAPTVTIVGGGGSGATATATLTGDVVTGITITAGGSGYTSEPTFIIAPPVAGATAAEGTVIRSDSGLVTGVQITNPGVGYITAPTVSFGSASSNLGGANITVVTTGNLSSVTAGPANSLGTVGAGLSAGVRAGNTTSLRAAAINLGAPVVTSGSGSATFNATAGNLNFHTVNVNRMSAVSTGGNITQTVGTTITTGNGSGTNSFNAGTGNITLTEANPFSGVVQLTANTASVRSSNNLTIGTTRTTGDLTLAGTTNARHITLGTGTGVGEGQAINVGGNLSVTTLTSGNITDNNYSSINVFGSVNLTSGSGDIILDAANAVGSFSPRVSLGMVNASTTGNVTLVETTGLNLGNISAGNLSATSVTGPVIDSGNITIALGGSASFSAAAGQTITIDGTNNILRTINVSGGGDSVFSGLNSDVVLGNSTAVTGNFSVSTVTGNVSIGAINATGNVTIAAGGWIDVVGAANINGNLSLTANGTIASASTLTAAGTAFGAVFAPGTANSSSSVGLISDSTGGITGISSSNLGLLTFTTAPTVTVATQTGAPAGATAPTVTANLSSTGQISGYNITSNGTGFNRALAAPAVTITGGVSNTSITQSGGTLNVTGTTTLASAGSTQLFRGNDFNNVVLAGTNGGAVINDVNNLTISGNGAGTLTVTAGASGSAIGSAVAGAPTQVASPWALTLGNLNVGGLVATAGNGGGGDSGRLTQASGTRVHSETLARFVATNNNIVIGNNGNNFGRVEVSVGSTDGSRTVTIVEDGTMKVGNVSSRGTTTLTSRFGSIIEDPAADVVITQNGTLTANSPTGSVLIGNTTHTTGTTTGNVVTFTSNTPNGAVAVQSSANLTLGNITALSLTASSGNNLLQSGRLSIYGASNFSATNNITLTNETNNFGRISVTTFSNDRDIAVTEAGTLNIGTVQMGSTGNATTNAAGGTGNITLTSVSGDIIDTGLGGAKFGGLIAPATALNAGAVLTGSGLVTLNASNGNIVLDDPTTDFQTTAGVVFTAGNVTLSPLGRTNLILGAANSTATAGNLTVTSATGNVLNGGNVTVTGDAFFQTGNGNITLTQSGNRFGTVRFSGNQVRITQANDINIVTGSSALGLAEFVSGSYITIANRGGIVTFGSTANFTASGTIVLPKLLQAAGTLTVNSPSTKDLSALSVSADLAGRSPINLGTGTYLPPQP